MKKNQLLLFVAALFFMGACSDDDEFKGYTDVKVDVTSPDENPTDVQVLVYDALKDNAYVKTIQGSNLTLNDLEASTYHLIALGNANGAIENKENYKQACLIQNLKAVNNLYAAQITDYVFPADLENLNFDLKKLNGVLKIKSTDTNSTDYDSLSVSVVIPKGRYELVGATCSGDAVTITKGFKTEGGIGFDEDFMVFPGNVSVSLEYFKAGNSVHTLDLGTAEVVTGQTVAIEKEFNEGMNRFIEIPDENLRDILKREFPAAFDGSVFDTQHESISALTEFKAGNARIKDFTGLQYLTGLTDLNISFNSEASGILDLSAMKNLVNCNVGYCGLEGLIIDGLESMESLTCGGNQLISLDVSTCTALTFIDFSMNPTLKEVSLGELPNVTMISAYDCAVEGTVDLTGYASLETIYWARNKCSGFNVSGLTKLTNLQISGNELTEVNVSGCTVLEDMAVDENDLATIDVSSCTNLTSLNVAQNFLTSLDVSSNVKLGYLYCNVNVLSSINVTDCAVLKSIICNDNKLETLDLSTCAELSDLTCNKNSLTTLDLRQNVALRSLDCYDNKLSSLNVTNLPKLSNLNIYNNELSSLDFTGCAYLQTLECYGPNQTFTDITGLSDCEYLWKMKIPASTVCGTNVKIWFENMDTSYMVLEYQDSEGDLLTYTADTCQ